MNILISGGSGFIGSALARSLLADGHKVWVLTRNPAAQKLNSSAQALGWDGRSTSGWLDVFSQMDAVVNLAGETVGRWPWNEARKQRIIDSRVRAGKVMAEAYQLAARKPAVLIQASGIGYYGPLGSEPVSESGNPGRDFMAGVASAWEASTASVDALPGVRRAIIRTSLVLDAREGVLPLMALPVRLFVGGPLGSGGQGVSWIHIDDEVRAIRFLIEQESARGVFNLCAPTPLASSDFIRELAKALRRPYWMPVPAFALKLILGDMSTLLLDGQFVLPERLQELGFIFDYEHVEQAFQAIYKG